MSGIWRGKQDIFIQDQYTDAVITYFNKITNSTLLTNPVSVDDKTITVDDPTGIVIGSYIILFNISLIRYTTFFVVGVAGSVITLDNPMDVAYPAGTFVDISIVDIAVDGSIAHQIFGIRNPTGDQPPGIQLSFDVTRIIMQCTASSPVELGLFGDLPPLTNGLFLRKNGSRFFNILNFKTNNDIANTMFDFIVYQSTNPAQGVDGFVSRLTFAGPNKIGVTVRLDLGEDMEIHVQDDLSGLTNFHIIAEGHIVD